ncbi:PA3496 family putative envelope integrity protein [Legionella sp. WA2022007384]
MNTREFDEEVNDTEEFSVDTILAPEASPSTKLERRRRIEDLFEEKRLREELAEFG